MAYKKLLHQFPQKIHQDSKNTDYVKTAGRLWLTSLERGKRNLYHRITSVSVSTGTK